MSFLKTWNSGLVIFSLACAVHAQSPTTCELALMHSDPTNDGFTHRLVLMQSLDFAGANGYTDTIYYDAKGRPALSKNVYGGIAETVVFKGTDSSYQWTMVQDRGDGTKIVSNHEVVSIQNGDTLREISRLTRNGVVDDMSVSMWAPGLYARWKTTPETYENFLQDTLETVEKAADTWYHTTFSDRSKKTWRCVDVGSSCECSDWNQTKQMERVQRGDTIEIRQDFLDGGWVKKWLPMQQAVLVPVRQKSQMHYSGFNSLSLKGGAWQKSTDALLEMRFGRIRVLGQ